MSDNSARDDLVRLLDESHDAAAGWHPWSWGHGADAILAAGWRPPLADACGCEPFSNCAKCWTPEQQREFEIQQLAYCEASVQASSDPEDGERCSNPRKPGSIFCENH